MENRRAKLLAVAVSMALTAACQRAPIVTAPPQQYTLMSPEDLLASRLVAMNHPAAMSYVASDIAPQLQQGFWRWTGRNPALRLRIENTANVSMQVDYFVPHEILRQHKEFTVRFLVNGHVVGEEKHSAPRECHFLKPVRPEWLNAGGENIVGMSLDRVFEPPEGGTPLGLILVRMGLVEP